MTSAEVKNTIILGLIFALRLLGLFMVLPILVLYLDKINGATVSLIGIAAGIYGLTQALFQLPLGILSDHIGRKPVLLLGLSVFAIGSLVAGFSESIWGLIVGRGLQGMGAIGAPVLALVADLTREQVRTQAMALIGISIGLTFTLAILLGPILDTYIGLSGIFILTACSAVFAMVLIGFISPSNTLKKPRALVHFALKDLWGLHLNVFILHAILTMSFLVLPLKIEEITGLVSACVWRFYLPVLGVALVIVAPLLRLADKKRGQRQAMMFAIASLGLSIVALIQSTQYHLFIGSVMVFFVAFNFLEASLPALMSQKAPKDSKGSSMGLYSFSQFLGMFAGGIIGGITLEVVGRVGVSMVCFLLTILALLLQRTGSRLWQEA